MPDYKAEMTNKAQIPNDKEKCFLRGVKESLPSWFTSAKGSSRGFTLIEVLITMALVGIIAIAFLGGLTTASRAVLTADVRTTAESMAKTQMESVKTGYIYYNEADHEEYETIGEYPYAVELVVEPINPSTGEPYNVDETGVFLGDDGIQKITVIVSHDGKEVFTLEGYNIDR